MTKYWKQAKKAIVGSVTAFVGALVAQVQAGATFGWKVVLLALGTAVITHAGIYSVNNEE